MRHKYDTRGIVLARTSLGEANSLVTLLTPTVGLVRARAQGIRKPGAKLAHGLTTLSESEVMLVQGKEGWRVVGAVLEEQWAKVLPHPGRERVARVTGLLLRLVADEARDERVFEVVRGFLAALRDRPVELHEAIELLAVLRLLGLLGLDAGDAVNPNGYEESFLQQVLKERAAYIQRINQGISASEL